MVSQSREDEITNIANEILGKLRDRRFMKSFIIFEKLITNSYINAFYEEAEFYSERNYLNRHDKLHALRVTLFALKVYEMLSDEMSLRHPFVSGVRPMYGFSILARCQLDPKIRHETADDLTCTCIIFSSFCHDMFKYMDHHNLLAAGQILSIGEDILKNIMTPETIDIVPEILLVKIQKCVAKHGGKSKADSAEEGIVMLSDVLDNDESRIVEASPVEVVLNDPEPVEYFSCKSIRHPMEVKKGMIRKIKITVTLKGDAGWHHVRELYEVTENSGLSNLISLFVNHPDLPGETELE